MPSLLIYHMWTYSCCSGLDSQQIAEAGGGGGGQSGVCKRDVCSVGKGVKVNLIGHVYCGRGAGEHLHSVAWPHLLQFWVSFPFAREITARIWKQ